MGSTESTAVRSLSNGVRLVVQRGASRRTSMELSPAEALARIVIGSSSQCDWRIFARGVRARHLRLVWSHGRLRIDDICEPGAVKLDGRPVCHRIELCAAASVAFGEAVLVVEPAGGGAGPPETELVPARTSPSDSARFAGAAGAGCATDSATAPPSAEAATVLDGLLDAPTAQQAAERQVRGQRRSPLRRKVALFSIAMIALLASAVARATLRAPDERSERVSAKPPARPAGPLAMRSSVTLGAARARSAQSVAGAIAPNEAVAHLVAGRRSEALKAYRALASKEPANRAYATVVQVLDGRSATGCGTASNGEVRCAP